MLPCLTLSIIRKWSRVKWSNPEKGVAPSPTHWYSSYRKGSLRVANFTYLLMYSSNPIHHKQDEIYITGLNSVFFLLYWLPYQGFRSPSRYHLLIARRKIDWFMPFPKVLAQSETQKSLPKSWTLVTNSISYDDNCFIEHYYCSWHKFKLNLLMKTWIFYFINFEITIW